MAAATYEDMFYTTRDGLRLHARHYPAAREGNAQPRPVVCLAGLTRNGRDFHEFAVALSGDSPQARNVYTLDYRGRGESQWDPDWKNYSVPVEALDVIDFLTMAGLHDVALIGTSRGGFVSMALAAIQPRFIGAVVLNDIGPVIDQKGLTRISAYVGRMPLPRDWPEAAKIVADMSRKAFPAVAASEWEPVARAWFNEKNGRPAQGYDPKLSHALSVLDGPMPELWPQFEALKHVPVLTLRGEKSDILSAATVEEMRRRHPAFSDFTVPGQGHAPLLRDAASITTIRKFLDEVAAQRPLATAAKA